MSIFDDDPEPVHTFFGLSYASYYVINRTVLQSMPVEWQRQWCKLAEQVREQFPHLPFPDYNVRVLKRQAQLISERNECDACGGDGEIDDLRDGIVYECNVCGGLGDIEGGVRYEEPEEVGFAADPIPNYDRGRTKLPRDFGKDSADD